MMLLVRERLRAIGAFDIKEICTATLVPGAGPGSAHTRSRISRRKSMIWSNFGRSALSRAMSGCGRLPLVMYTVVAFFLLAQLALVQPRGLGWLRKHRLARNFSGNRSREG